jgi:hypothetical protein
MQRSRAATPRHSHPAVYVLNAAARLVCSGRRCDRITPLLRDLHWLRVCERIDLKLVMRAFQCLQALAPSYFADPLHQGESSRS